MKKTVDFGIYLEHLTNTEFVKIKQKFDNLIDFWDSYGFDDKFLYMEHLTLKQFNEVQQWLKDTFNC